MKKLQIVLEMEIDEEELKNMISSENNCEPLTTEEYIEGMKFRFRYGRMEFVNEIEEYYNVSEGDSQCLKNPKVVTIKEVE